MTVPTPFPRIERFEKLAFGMFMHWGLYSHTGRGEWIRKLGDQPHEEYDALFNKFTAEKFDAQAIARLARDSGIRYITLTTRHHDGFSLYDTCGLSKFDAPHSPAKRDLVAEFITACKQEGILPILYHTTLDWQWKSDTCSEDDFNRYLDYLLASVEILCTRYGDIGGLWFDGNWSRPKADWKENRLYDMIRKNQPEAMIINNTGMVDRGAIGKPEIDSITFEQGLPKPLDRTGHPKYLAAEMCQTMNAHWGIGAWDFKYLSPAQVIENLCLSRRAGANYLLNVGPTASGLIPEYEAAVLRRVGEWIAIFPEAIYEGKPEPVICQGRDFVLRTGDQRFFYFAFDIQIAGHVDVTVHENGIGPRAIKGFKHSIQSIQWLDNQESLAFAQKDDLATIDLTDYPYGSNLVVRIAEIILA